MNACLVMNEYIRDGIRNLLTFAEQTELERDDSLYRPRLLGFCSYILYRKLEATLLLSFLDDIRDIMDVQGRKPYREQLHVLTALIDMVLNDLDDQTLMMAPKRARNYPGLTVGS